MNVIQRVHAPALMSLVPRAKLSFIPGTTIKMWQLTGDFDPQRKVPTASRSGTRANVRATDLGATFEHGGRLYFLFGDTTPARPELNNLADDCIAWTNAADPTTAPFLQWLTDDAGGFNAVRISTGGLPLAIEYGGYCVPQSGFEGANRVMYIFYTQAVTKADPNSNEDVTEYISSVLARSDDDGLTFRYMYHASFDKFYQPWPQVVNASDWPMLPFRNGKVVLIWGTSTAYRNSDVYLACCPLSEIETATGVFIKQPTQWAYFAGVFDHAPVWSSLEREAVPLFKQPNAEGQPAIGEFSVAYIPAVRKWLMLYCHPGDATQPRGIYCREADQPWGPWELLDRTANGKFDVELPALDGVIWTPDLGYGQYIHRRDIDDGLDLYGDSFGAPAPQASSEFYEVYDPISGWHRYEGGEYASYLISRWCSYSNNELLIRFSLSTWDPYQVILLQSSLHVDWMMA